MFFKVYKFAKFWVANPKYLFSAYSMLTRTFSGNDPLNFISNYNYNLGRGLLIFKKLGHRVQSS